MDIWLPKMMVKTVDTELDMRIDARMKDILYNDCFKKIVVQQMCLRNSLAMKNQYGYCPRTELYENVYNNLLEDEIPSPSLDFLDYINSMIDQAFSITYLAQNHFPFQIKLNIIPNNVDTNTVYITKYALEKGISNHLTLMVAHRGSKIPLR